MTDTLQKRFEYPSSDVTPEFVTSAEQGNVLPALARLLIDRVQGDLTNERRPTMLNLDKELPQWALN
jgi:hypothetical protein